MLCGAACRVLDRAAPRPRSSAGRKRPQRRPRSSRSGTTGRFSAASRSSSGGFGVAMHSTAWPSPSATINGFDHDGRARHQHDRRVHPGAQRRMAEPGGAGSTASSATAGSSPSGQRLEWLIREADKRGMVVHGRPDLATQGPGPLRRGRHPARDRGSRPGFSRNVS